MKKTNDYLLALAIAGIAYVVYILNKDKEPDVIIKEKIVDPENLAEAESTEVDNTGEIETTSGDIEEAEIDNNTGVTTIETSDPYVDPASGEDIYGGATVTPFDKVQVRVRHLDNGLYEFKAIFNEELEYTDLSGYNPDFAYPSLDQWEFTTFNVNDGQGDIQLLPDQAIEVQYTQSAIIPISAKFDFDNSIYDPTIDFELDVVYFDNTVNTQSGGGSNVNNELLGNESKVD